tara:strand:- start:4426 stop:5376 length:951 start_codon:yes stop_codon:yes gene_type:complete
VPQSIIFSGPKGIGKSKLALTFSEQLMQDKKSITSHDLLSNFAASSNSKKVYICKREFDEATNKYKSAISIDQIRKMKEFFSLSQTEYNWRIAIIDAADEMNESSSNAILKLLEEPPNKSIIILISHNYYSLKSTIISRCQKITLKPLSENEMGEFLSKEVNNQEEINLITSLSEGIPSLALNLTNEETLNTYKRLIDLVSNTENSTQSQIFDLIESQKFGNQNEVSLDLIDLILILIRRVIRSLLNDEELVTNDVESQMFEKIVDQSNMTIILAELYLDLEQTIARAKRINIEKADISLNCLTKLKTVFREKICL